MQIVLGFLCVQLLDVGLWKVQLNHSTTEMNKNFTCGPASIKNLDLGISAATSLSRNHLLSYCG